MQLCQQSRPGISSAVVKRRSAIINLFSIAISKSPVAFPSGICIWSECCKLAKTPLTRNDIVRVFFLFPIQSVGRRNISNVGKTGGVDIQIFIKSQTPKAMLTKQSDEQSNNNMQKSLIKVGRLEREKCTAAG
ncbi:hypothetical protein TSPI_08875 [Trichinella spiralis]|uniref:Uncharacterized protein n=1 Tax=Trichinella spiralis TaxID=6334 RepID=A0ABR3KCD2_TRISP